MADTIKVKLLVDAHYRGVNAKAGDVIDMFPADARQLFEAGQGIEAGQEDPAAAEAAAIEAIETAVREEPRARRK